MELNVRGRLGNYTLVYHDIIFSYQKTIRETLRNSDTAILEFANYLCENIPLVGVDVSKLDF